MDENWCIGNATLDEVIEAFALGEGYPYDDSTVALARDFLDGPDSAGVGYGDKWLVDIKKLLRTLNIFEPQHVAITCAAVVLEEVCHAAGFEHYGKIKCGRFVDHLRYVILVSSYLPAE